MRQETAQIIFAFVTLGVVMPVHAISPPIQTQRGIVRLGSKTEAKVDSDHSTVAIGEGMALLSAKPGGLGRATLKVSFDGAPMVAKVQGTALVAYLPGKFIEITGVEGRVCLSREGRLGENIAIDAGKMVLVKPTAVRLPDPTDVELSSFVKNSPMLKDIDLATSPLVARAVQRQARNRYLKPTPLYFDGAGTEALVSNDTEKSRTAKKLDDEDTPANGSVVAIGTVEQMPRRVASESILVAFNSSPGQGGLPGNEPLGSQPPGLQPPEPQPPGSQPLGSQPPVPQFPEPQSPVPQPPVPQLPAPQPSTLDLPGTPLADTVVFQGSNIVPARGFYAEFNVVEHGTIVATVWLPPGMSNSVAEAILLGRPLNLNHNLNPGDLTFVPTERQGLGQAAVSGTTSDNAPFLIFKQAKITNSPTFTINPIQGPSQIELRLSQTDIPSDILTRNEFLQTFHNLIGGPPGKFYGAWLGYDESPALHLTAENSTIEEVIQNNPPAMKIEVPLQGLKYTWNGFFNQPPTAPTNSPNDLIAPDNSQLVGLDQKTLLGSTYVRVIDGKGVTLSGNGISFVTENKTVATGLQFQKSDVPGIFSVQASPPASPVSMTPFLRIESDGPLTISDPTFEPSSVTGEPGTSALAGVEIISKQDISVKSMASTPITVTVPPVAAPVKPSPVAAGGQIELAVDAKTAVKLSQDLDYWIGGFGRVKFSSQSKDANGQFIAKFTTYSEIDEAIPDGTPIYDQDPSLHGQLVFHASTLNANQGISVSSAKRIRIEDSSQLNSLTDIVMQGGGTADLEVISNSRINAPNGQIFLDQFHNITIDSAQLMASVIKARVISPTGTLMINNSTLAAGKLLSLYAEGANGTVEFRGTVNLTGKQIDIAGNTVLVDKYGRVTTSPNTSVYANTHNYNDKKGEFGTINNAQQKPFGARPPL